MTGNPIQSLWLLWGGTNVKHEDRSEVEEDFEEEELMSLDSRTLRHNSLCGYFLVTLATLVISVKEGKEVEWDHCLGEIRVVDDAVQYYGVVVQF